MKEKIAHWQSEIKAVTAQVEQLFGNLTDEELNRKPNPETWSVAQNLEHLIVVNETYFPVIQQVKSGEYKTPCWAGLSFVVDFFGNFILKSVEPSRRRKMKTFPIWEPSTSNVKAGICRRFSWHQEEIAALFESCERLLERGTVISSPANRNIVYKLERAFDIIVEHEKRHLNQAIETWNQLKTN